MSNIKRDLAKLEEDKQEILKKIETKLKSDEFDEFKRYCKKFDK